MYENFRDELKEIFAKLKTKTPLIENIDTMIVRCDVTECCSQCDLTDFRNFIIHLLYCKAKYNLKKKPEKQLLERLQEINNDFEFD